MLLIAYLNFYIQKYIFEHCLVYLKDLFHIILSFANLFQRRSVARELSLPFKVSFPPFFFLPVNVAL